MGEKKYPNTDLRLFVMVAFPFSATRWRCFRSSSGAPAAPLSSDLHQTGGDGGGVFSNGTDFKSFTYLFICPVEVVQLPDANVTGFIFFFLGGFGADNSVNKHQKGGRKRGVLGSRKADGAGICVRCQTAPQNTSTDWD